MFDFIVIAVMKLLGFEDQIRPHSDDYVPVPRKESQGSVAAGIWDQNGTGFNNYQSDEDVSPTSSPVESDHATIDEDTQSMSASTAMSEDLRADNYDTVELASIEHDEEISFPMGEDLCLEFSAVNEGVDFVDEGTISLGDDGQVAIDFSADPGTGNECGEAGDGPGGSDSEDGGDGDTNLSDEGTF